jgi:hypothetical protein
MNMLADSTPNGNSMIYSSKTPQGFRIVRTPLRGGAPVNLFLATVAVGRYSPAGKEVGVLAFEGEISMKNATLLVIDSTDGRVERTFLLPPGDLPSNFGGWLLRWTGDGKALTYALQQGSTVNLWRQAVAGGQPIQLTHFPDELIAYAWSLDGKHLAVTRQTSSRDVVLFRNFR